MNIIDKKRSIMNPLDKNSFDYVFFHFDQLVKKEEEHFQTKKHQTVRRNNQDR